MSACTDCADTGVVVIHEPGGDIEAPCPYCRVVAAREWSAGCEPVQTTPLARLVPLSVPDETELEFYHRRFREIAKELAAERGKSERLTLRILELLEEEA